MYPICLILIHVTVVVPWALVVYVICSIDVGTNFKVGGLKLCSRSLKQGSGGRSLPEAVGYFIVTLTLSSYNDALLHI